MKKYTLAAIIATTAAFAQSTAPPNSPTALALLERVSRHYADAKSYHIEWVEERTSSNDFQRNWEKTLLTAAGAPGNRYRYEGRSGLGGAVKVSDGKTIWTHHLEEHQYTEKPVVAEVSDEPKVIPYAEMALNQAENLHKILGDAAKRYKSATRLADAVLNISGQEVPCYVIRLETADLKRIQPEYSFEKTLWIDKIHETILKSVEHAHTYVMAGAAHIPLEEETTTTYSLTYFDASVPGNLFSFSPPSEAKLVKDFPDPLKNAGGPDLTGQTIPSLKLNSSDGKLTSLESFRGKPVLLELWATWCAPCVKGLSQLAQMYQDTKDKGLVFISIDQDEEAENATQFLAKKAYAWPNFHDDGGISKDLGSSGIPRTILIDAKGEVVYDRIGTSRKDELLTAVAKLGPEYASFAPKPREAPCPAPQ
jgi:thiol-disulfide isomerase/thioredoxin